MCVLWACATSAHRSFWRSRMRMRYCQTLSWRLTMTTICCILCSQKLSRWASGTCVVDLLGGHGGIMECRKLGKCDGKLSSLSLLDFGIVMPGVLLRSHGASGCDKHKELGDVVSHSSLLLFIHGWHGLGIVVCVQMERCWYRSNYYKDEHETWCIHTTSCERIR